MGIGIFGGIKYAVQGITAGDGIGDGADGYNDVVCIIPPTLNKCTVAAKINILTIITCFLAGFNGGYIGQVPGLLAIFELTTIFCIVPGAGINGIGNGFICAPIQYALTPLPNSFTNEKLTPGGVANPFNSAS